MPWYLYIIQCSDKKLYTGITNNLKRRISEHNSGNGCKFTCRRVPVKLLFSEEYLTKSEALEREIQIKGLRRDKKLSLINAVRSPSALQPQD
jgi:putative endonuclease